MSRTPRPFTALPGNATQRGASLRNAVQPIHKFDETNPIFEPTDSPLGSSLAALKAVAGAAAQKPAPIAAGACNVAHHDATPRNAVQQDLRTRKTNPIPQIELDPRRLAAARLLAMGRSLADAAAELKLNRTTVWRWQRDPAFRAELRRIHERMVVAASGRRGV